MRGRQTTHPAHTYFPGRFYLQFSCPEGSQQLARSKANCFREGFQESSQEACAWNKECYDTMSTRGILYSFKLNSKSSLLEWSWPKLSHTKATSNTLQLPLPGEVNIGKCTTPYCAAPCLGSCFISSKNPQLTKKSLVANSFT